MSRSQVSIVIPCYNHGQYLDEALQSIHQAQAGPVEILIVNDGSTDPATIEKLRSLEQQGYRVIHQPNQGLAAARPAMAYGWPKALSSFHSTAITGCTPITSRKQSIF